MYGWPTRPRLTECDRRRPRTCQLYSRCWRRIRRSPQSRLRLSLMPRPGGSTSAGSAWQPPRTSPSTSRSTPSEMRKEQRRSARWARQRWCSCPTSPTTATRPRSSKQSSSPTPTAVAAWLDHWCSEPSTTPAPPPAARCSCSHTSTMLTTVARALPAAWLHRRGRGLPPRPLALLRVEQQRTCLLEHPAARRPRGSRCRLVRGRAGLWVALFGQIERTYLIERAAHARSVAVAKGRAGLWLSGLVVRSLVVKPGRGW